MRYLKISLLLLSIIFTSCAGTFPGVGILAPKTLGGYEMDATGLEGSYYYKFSADGTYDRKTVLPSGETTKPKKGTWKWERTSPRNAVLTFDEALVVTLTFTTHQHANASIETSNRLYPVEFTKP